MIVMFLRKLITFLICKKLGIKRYQEFQFDNQKSEFEYYWFDNDSLMKMRVDGVCEESHVSLNWLLNDSCKVNVVNLDALFGDGDGIW